jgi:hypothetical protein
MPAKQIHELDLTQSIDDNTLFICSVEEITFAVKFAALRALITKASLGLDQVDNTPDLNKPISRAVQQALALKADLEHTHALNEIIGLLDALAQKADKVHEHGINDIIGLTVALSQNGYPV